MASDLHLLARRSRGDALAGALADAAQRNGALVLAGDIFDVRWSTAGGPAETARFARNWLRELLGRAPDASLHYVLGNHDDVPELREGLTALAATEERFAWHPHHLRLGAALFVHGDLDRPRSPHQGSRPGRARERAYDAAIALRLHRAAASLAFPHRAVLRELHDYADRVEADEDGGAIRDVFFGHTHRPMTREPFRGRRYHNGGAPIDGVRFRIIEESIG